MTLKEKIEELAKEQKDYSDGYAHGWTDGLNKVLELIEEEETKCKNCCHGLSDRICGYCSYSS